MKMRYFAFLCGTPTTAKVRHYVGLPPQLTGGKDTRREMGPPDFLVIDDGPNGVFLFRYTSSGQCVGDTWHLSIDDAEHQATYEFEGLIGGWEVLPEGTEDVVAYCLERMKG